MNYVAAVTMLLLFQYFFFMVRAGMARGKGDTQIQAPAMSGSEDFERKSRIHLNTLEQLMIAMPAMWVCANYANPNIAAGLGLMFFVGRVIYSIAYLKDPTKRAAGMIIGVLANLALMLITCWHLLSLAMA